jgi:predicted HTH transcriptional regulator
VGAVPKSLSLDDCRNLLASADYMSFVDAVETEHIEFKSEPYRLENDLQKQELAKDVSGLANAGGGVILIGFKTTKDATVLGGNSSGGS